MPFTPPLIAPRCYRSIWGLGISPAKLAFGFQAQRVIEACHHLALARLASLQIPMHRNRKRPFEHEKARAVDAKFATAISAGPTPSQPLQPSNPRVPSVQAEQGLLMCAASLLQTSQSYRQTVQKMPAFQRESEGLPSWVLQHTAMPLTFERSRTSVAATPFVLPPRAALPAPGGTQQAPLPSPGWPSCSTERQRLPSDDDSSPRGQQQHVLASDVQEAVLSGGRLSLNLESLLFLPAAASGNAAAAVRNRKTGACGGTWLPWLLATRWQLPRPTLIDAQEWCSRLPWLQRRVLPAAPSCCLHVFLGCLPACSPACRAGYVRAVCASQSRHTSF